MSSKRRNTRCAFVAGVQTYSLPISLPGILWIGAMAALTGDYDLGTTAFLNWAFGSETWDERWRFWFLEALVWILLGTAVLFKIGWVRRAEAARPFAFRSEEHTSELQSLMRISYGGFCVTTKKKKQY